MEPANSEVGGTTFRSVECWAALETCGLEVCGMPRDSLGVCLRGAGV